MSAAFFISDPASSLVGMLLALMALMFIATALTALFLWRRANTPIPPHIQFLENLNAEPEEC